MAAMRRGIALCLTGLAMTLIACGSDDEPSTPVACLGGAAGFIEALEAAPQAVSVDGTSIGECLSAEQSAGQIAEVGEALVAAATQLNDRARRDPLGDATLQLGYLVGAVDARADQTAGIHADLALRVESAATFVPEDQILPGGFQQRYEEGVAAGRQSVG
jgi:hypothetical protein